MGFYSSENARTDDVIVQGNDEDRSFPRIEFISIQFAKALAFLRFNFNLVSSGTSGKRRREKLEESESMKEYYFIQYYDVLPKNIVSLDKIERNLGCVRLMLERENGV